MLNVARNSRRVAKQIGLVLFRQQQTAKGTIFLSVEDKTGVTNLIVRKDVQNKFRRAVYAGKLLLCRGIVQKEGQALQLVARSFWDWSDKLRQLHAAPGTAALPVKSRDF